MSKPLISVRPKPEVARLIREFAAEDRRPVSQFLSILIEDALEKRSSEPKRSASPRAAA
jgi:hypothetical protein